jgi:predicted PP-loop superfamily ATPase
MVCISLVYCNSVRTCVHPLWIEGVHACRCSIDRRSVARRGATDWSVSVATSGGTDSPASASWRRRPGIFIVPIHYSC